MQGGVGNAVGGTEPAQEGSSLLCWGAQAMGTHWRDFTSEEHNQTYIFRRISSEESDLENRPQEGRPACNTLAEWQGVPGIHWGNFFFPSDILTFTLSDKAKMLDGAHKTPTSQACDKVPHTHTQIQIWANHLEEASVPQLSCSFAKQFPVMTPGVLSSDKAISGTFTQYWTKKNKHSGTAQQRKLWQPAPLLGFPDL